MKANRFFACALVIAASLVSLQLSAAPAAADNSEARLLRFPSIGGGKVVFTYAGDLYSVDENGGVASKLTNHVGYEMFAKISPDGKTIMFTGQYDGNTELYSMPIAGGEPERISFSATLDRDDIGDRMGPNNIVMGWTPDGKKVIYRSRWYTFSGLRGRLFTVDAKGGMPEMLPATEGGFCSFSPDGKYLAMNRMFREFRTWKYYRGGQADDIYIHKLGTTKLEKITDNDAQDIFPMWVGDRIFYLSDRDRTMNLFVYDTKTKQTQKVTNFTEYDCKFPSSNDGKIVFENGGYIYKYTVASGKLEKLTIYLNQDNIWSRSELGSVGRGFAYTLSPDSKRILAVYRGDIFSMPAQNGAVYNLTNSPQSHEREVCWSPDGKTVAWFSDADGEYNVYAASYEKISSPRKLTSFKNGYPRGLQWSPDSRTLYFSNDERDVFALDLASSSVKVILSANPKNNPKTNGKAMRGFVLSKDGSWAAYTQGLDNDVSAIFLYNIASGKSYQVTDKWYDCSNPLFSDDGKYLFFTSATNFSSQYSQVEWNTSYRVSSNVFVVSLAKDTPNPTAFSNDDYDAAAPASANDAPKAKGAANAPAKKAAATKVDIDGIGQRIYPINELSPSMYRLVKAADGKLYYNAFGGFGGFGRGEAGMKVFDLKTRKIDKGQDYSVLCFAADGKKALVRSKGKLYVANFGSPANGKEVPESELEMTIDHKAEWKQIFDESWRITRDGFYVENMHGADWNHIYEKYSQLVPYVNHRHDLTYIIGEMLGELNVGHAYITSGNAPVVKRIKTGLLGAQFSRDKSGAFRIEKIFKGENWSEKHRSPLTEAGVNAKVGEYVVSINRVPAAQYANIYQALTGKAGVPVELQISSTGDGKDARTVIVKPVADESGLAYYEWVQGNIAKVEKLSGGKIGYIHIPDMSTVGLDQFTKLFYSQLDKKALIIDDRMNGGGNVSPIIMERLQRVVYRMSMYRNGANEPVPNQAHYGPKVCLIDKYSSSDGDLFPWGFQSLKLGKVIGKRSWGGIVGISGSKPFVDGQDMRTPFFTSYGLDGKWIIEGHGVDPDIEIDINPFEDYLGTDAQLNKAVEVLLEELKGWPELPGTPAAPVKNN